MRRVLFAERRLPHYRPVLFDAIRQRLREDGIHFDFIHGQPSADELSKRDEGRLDWALQMPATRYALGGKLVWQPFSTANYDLVIIDQENRLLFNHWLCRPTRPFKLAFFGHGADLGATDPRGLRERFKRFTTRRVDWWFAYTELSRRLVQDAGFPADRITVVDNATDTTALRAHLDAVEPGRLAELRRSLGLSPGKTALFLGSLYPGKQIPLLLQAAGRVHRADPAFRLLMVGDGPSRAESQASTAGAPWIAWLGPRRGVEKAELMAASDVLALPGAVGLAIVDAFAAGLPVLSTSAPGHGPEIAYLERGANGEITAPDAVAYADELQRLLNDPARLARWQARARADAHRYTVQAMAGSFALGIAEALQRPRL